MIIGGKVWCGWWWMTNNLCKKFNVHLPGLWQGLHQILSLFPGFLDSSKIQPCVILWKEEESMKDFAEILGDAHFRCSSSFFFWCWVLLLQSINNRWHQMALQLTMHRLTGGIVPTYESASTRRWENSWNRKHLGFASWNFWIFVIFSILYVIFNLHVSGKTLRKRQAGRI